jgi:hypothetical protein
MATPIRPSSTKSTTTTHAQPRGTMSPIKTYDDLQPRLRLMEKEGKLTAGSLQFVPGPMLSTGNQTFDVFHVEGDLRKQIGKTLTARPIMATLNLLLKNSWTVIRTIVAPQATATPGRQRKTA